LDDLREGVGWGLYLAAAYSAIALIAVLLGGGRVIGEVGATFLFVLIGYFLGGLMSGVIWGLGRPLGRTPTGSVLLGFVVILPASFVLSSIVIPVDEWRNGGRLCSRPRCGRD
jgi:hypothetical protein